MPTYATQQDCLDYTPGLQIDDPAGFDALIDAAERDVDRLLGNWPVDPDAGLKAPDPALLPPVWRAALTRATCAQVEWLLTPGVAAQQTQPRAKVTGPDFTVEPARDPAAVDGRIGPKVRGELRCAPGLVNPWAPAG